MKKLISPLLTRTQGSQGCQKMRQDQLNMLHEVWSANIALKLKNIQKTLRKQRFLRIFFSILTAFCSFYNLRAILAQKENSFICRKKNVIFWHPWDPWGRVNSGKNFFLDQTATVYWVSVVRDHNHFHLLSFAVLTHGIVIHLQAVHSVLAHHKCSVKNIGTIY